MCSFFRLRCSPSPTKHLNEHSDCARGVLFTNTESSHRKQINVQCLTMRMQIISFAWDYTFTKVSWSQWKWAIVQSHYCTLLTRCLSLFSILVYFTFKKKSNLTFLRTEFDTRRLFFTFICSKGKVSPVICYITASLELIVIQYSRCDVEIWSLQRDSERFWLLWWGWRSRCNLLQFLTR